MAFTVVLEGGSPWGFRLQGGKDFEEALKIAKINPNSKAYSQGVHVGDYLEKINGATTDGLQHHEALQLIKNANQRLVLELHRNDGQKGKNDTNVNKSQRIVNSTSSQSDSQLHKPMNGDVRQNMDINNIHNNNEGETTVKRYKPVSFKNSSPHGTGDSTQVPFNSKPVEKPTDLRVNGTSDTGLWTPGHSQTSLSDDLTTKEDVSFKDIAPIWSPTGTSGTIKKGFKSVKLDTSAKPKNPEMSRKQGPPADSSFTWNPTERSTALATATTTTTTTTLTPTATTTTTTTSTIPSPSHASHATWNGNISNMEDSKSGLPKPQSPTITLLQKNRDDDDQSFPITSGMHSIRTEEGQLPKGAVYVGTKETIEGDQRHIDTYYMAPSGEKTTTVTKVEKKAPKHAGVGPTTKKKKVPTATLR